MRGKILDYYDQHPLRFILVAGFLIRMISVLFSSGYGMHDDHFLVVEAAQSWVDGFDYNHWLPSNRSDGQPTGHSFFYVGIHYFLFLLSDSAGLDDPMMKMFLVRFLHALWSMLAVYFGYRLAAMRFGPEAARLTGLLLSLLWFYPILSVRNMVEMVCVPFILMSFYHLSKQQQGYRTVVFAGIFMGLAVAVRVQTYLLLGGAGLVLLIERRVGHAFIFGLSSLLMLFITQASDLYFWHRPFAELTQYVLYNSSHYDDYITQAWYQYLLLIGGLLIPPLSLMILFGFLRSWKKNAMLFIPSLIFILFHSFYPNKQERFILPVLPLVIILGIGCWRQFSSSSSFWTSRPALTKGIMKSFWTLNITALLFISPSPTKLSRIDTMYKLREMKDVTGLLIERTKSYGCYLLPRYYHGDWQMHHFCYSGDEVARYPADQLPAIAQQQKLNYCLFVESEEIEERMKRMSVEFPGMKLITVIKPSYIDRLMHFLNPVNENETIFICRLYTDPAKV